MMNIQSNNYEVLFNIFIINVIINLIMNKIKIMEVWFEYNHHGMCKSPTFIN